MTVASRDPVTTASRATHCSCGVKLYPKRNRNAPADLCSYCYSQTEGYKALHREQQRIGQRRLRERPEEIRNAHCNQCVHYCARCTLDFRDFGAGGEFAKSCPAYIVDPDKAPAKG